ncbi:MAG: beta-lactamase family protein [Gemmatimonadetes bacterium]|nr:beta-lactamase family protein [Gemmatimonadota bacterium]
MIEVLSRRTRKWAVALALAACAAPHSARAQLVPATPAAAVPARYAAAIDSARAFLRDSIARKGIPGVSVAVAVNGEIIWSEGFGYADVENRVPVTALTRFRVASVSKPLTAAAIARLYEDGKLDLDAPVQRYVPSFPRKGAYVVTPRLLAGHLAGIRHYRDDDEPVSAGQKHYPTVLASLDVFRDDSLVAPPGTRFSYSTFGWNLLSAVVEGASGQEFLAHMRERVFLPLGMRSTVAEHQDSIIEGRARFYEHGADGRLVNAPYVDNSYKWAGGGFLSNAEDLARFGSAHLKPGFLRPETLRLLFTSQRTADGKETGYGIGWSVGRDAQGRRMYSHSGGATGGNSFLLLYPDQGVVVAILTNTTDRLVGSGSGAREVARLFLR